MKEAEKLAPNHPLTEDIIESIPSGILILHDGYKAPIFNQTFADLWKITGSASVEKSSILKHLALQLKTPDAFEKANDLSQKMAIERSDFFKLKDDGIIEGRSKPYVSNGKVTGVAWSFTDVTQHKAEDRALRESDLRLRKIFETSALGILITNINSTIAQGDTRGATLKVNAAFLKMVGYSEEEFNTLGVNGITHPDDWEIDLSLFLDMVAGKIDHYKIEKRYYQKNGNMIWVRIVASMGEDAHGKPPFAMAMIDDITEIKNLMQEREVLLMAERTAKESAETALKLRDEFLAIASHELRTPLSPIKMLLSVLSRNIESAASGLAKGEALKKLAQNTEKQIDRLVVLVEGLLDVSRITRGKLTINLEKCELSSLVREVTDRHADELLRAGCTLILENLNAVAGNWDQQRLEQVVTNLLLNAIKYGAGKPIELSTVKVNNAAIFIMRDQGIGIAKGDQENIFNRFVRAVPITSYGGMGLGLYIAKQIVDAHLGTIRVESELGQGATFIVELPTDLEKA